MSTIEVIANKLISHSRFIKMQNVTFMQNGQQRSWDYISSMDAVSALVFDKVNRNFICIKQFRPPLRFGASSLTVNTIPAEQLGFCYELCAGLMDIEGRSKEQTVVDEIRARGYMFYAEVTPEQKKYPGGGLASEGEQIEIVELSEQTIDDFLLDDKKEKAASFYIALYWWKHLRNQTNK
ncbi:uridine diphosphate glucose pyrophosphatase [Blastocystis sp. subtype 4]|uniref:uridine diphosphate glucose pyrophosphatase n=1 Tax=Blastocystis sp. subtype 4 TaxID=944170 RepID=UPI0007116A55|nr:uridine diphosphate glucose pyrophosphatase [Blastocystis sp. subtype 4]KNB45281.1 uridine diphosphate glucose pyrophosphatase [Blastocystis sp. subtype 4]|eukprot:XP_014528724.1 uridine diphosphate glucose pyrophosphatase [Blastocystis sp. subtype 4]